MESNQLAHEPKATVSSALVHTGTARDYLELLDI